jgi:hypothetical protein
MFVTTPKEISSEVRAFCRSICKKHLPIFVRVETRSHSLIGECFVNVRTTVELEGGQQIYGWTIWNRPGVFIEAENHSVWRAPDGALVDVSPAPDQETQVLFLQDDDAKPIGGIGNNNHRKALNDDPLVRRYVTLHNRISCADIKRKRGLNCKPLPNKIIVEFEVLKVQLGERYSPA